MTTEPLIIAPGDHPITLEAIDRDALFVLRKLNQGGFSSYLVGGGVRDLYQGKPPKDFDISTNARPGQIRRLFSNSRTIGRRFRLVQVFFKNGKIIEVSTLRSLSEHDLDGPEAVLAPNNTYGTLDQDAQRRDITINGLFYEIENQTIIDYVGGVDDLDQGVIRIIGDPVKRINRDPVRMMRVIRHSARNDFIIDKASWAAICAHSEKLTLCPPSRLRDELLKDIYSGVSAQWYQLAQQSNLFETLFRPYKKLMSRQLPNGSLCSEQLHSIFSVIDRVNNDAVANKFHRQPSHFLLAFLLLPWAFICFNLDSAHPKGPQIFQLSKQIREALNQSIGPQMNLKRSARQEITSLLSHLPSLMHYHQSRGWPKWMKKKSYFAQCRLLFCFYREAFEQIPVPDSLFSAHQPTSPKQSRHPSKKRSKRKGRPAFSDARNGGVFGFKR